ncbi:MAG: nucleotidyl transferase AbiEii/AbiGii toxin family protein [Gammaproteobacteria bacterium]
MLAAITQAIPPICHCELAVDDHHALNVGYPAAFSDEYLRPEVRLEIGPLAAWLPFDSYKIRPYAAEAFPRLFTQADCTVQAIRAERTFWEKATILHHEANRPEGNQQSRRVIPDTMTTWR